MIKIVQFFKHCFRVEREVKRLCQDQHSRDFSRRINLTNPTDKLGCGLYWPNLAIKNSLTTVCKTSENGRKSTIRCRIWYAEGLCFDPLWTYIHNNMFSILNLSQSFVGATIWSCMSVLLTFHTTHEVKTLPSGSSSWPPFGFRHRFKNLIWPSDNKLISIPGNLWHSQSFCRWQRRTNSLLIEMTGSWHRRQIITKPTC